MDAGCRFDKSKPQDIFLKFARTESMGTSLLQMPVRQVWEKYSSAALALDSRSLSLLRIALGITILLSIWLRLPDFLAHYTEAGVLPLEMMRLEWRERMLWSLFALSPDIWWTAGLFAITAICAFSFAAGWGGRPVTLLLWVLLLSLHNRNPLILNSGDHLLLSTLFWSLFLPLGLHWNLPAPWRRWTRTRIPGSTPARKVVGIPSLAIILQFVFLYSIGALIKWGAEWQSEFSAVWYSLQLPSFVLPPGEFLGNFPAFSLLMTPVVLWSELLVPLLLLIPWKNALWRMIVVVFGIGLQAGFASMLALGLFPLACICIALPLLPSAFWESLRRFLRKAVPPSAESPPVLPTGVQSALCSVALLMVFFGNMETVPANNSGKLSLIRDSIQFTFPDSFPAKAAGVLSATAMQTGDFFCLRQNWKMFAPRPKSLDGPVILEALLADGTVTDLMPHLRSLDLPYADLENPPPSGSLAGYHTPRWRKYFSKLTLQGKRHFFPALDRYLTNRWNAAKPEHLHIVSLQAFTNFQRNRWENEPEILGKIEIYPSFGPFVAEPDEEGEPEKKSALVKDVLGG